MIDPELSALPPATHRVVPTFLVITYPVPAETGASDGHPGRQATGLGELGGVTGIERSRRQ